MAQNAAITFGYPILVFSLEMSSQLAERMFAPRPESSRRSSGGDCFTARI
jgi:hypothetical protein